MTKNERLEALKNLLENTKEPMSGSALAKELHVSRQVIVQDIALLKASDVPVLSTNRGYILPDQGVKEIIKVSHSSKQMEEELNIIVDCGAWVENVFVEHPTYGHIEVELMIRSRRDVKAFLQKIREEKAQPLNKLTQGIHYHTIHAPSRDVLEEVKACLDKHHILC